MVRGRSSHLLHLRSGNRFQRARDGDLVATGAGAAALGSPLAAVAWLANVLHTVGESLRAGQFVMTGALHAAVDIKPGQHYRAEFDRLGPVTLNAV